MIKELILYTVDIEKTFDFYSKKLKFKVFEYNNFSFKIFITKNNTITFKTTDKLLNLYHLAFNIPNNKIEWNKEYYEGVLSWIEYNNKKIIDLVCWGERSLYFYDNNGNILEFITREDNVEMTIGEIGIPMNNILMKRDKIKEILNLSFYKENCMNSNFFSLGSNKGILIFVEEGKTWFPTSIKAHFCEMEILLFHNNMEYKLILKNNKLLIENNETQILYEL